VAKSYATPMLRVLLPNASDPHPAVAGVAFTTRGNIVNVSTGPREVERNQFHVGVSSGGVWVGGVNIRVSPL
jgi:type VI protein secretion system component VasA